MNPLPSSHLVLSDGGGRRIGVLHLAAPPADKLTGDCIFDIEDPTANARNEARWLHKRRFRRSGEHRYKLDEHGGITVSQADFSVAFVPTEDGRMRTKPPAPLVYADWGPDPG